MKTLINTLIGLTALTLLASCGGNSLEAKKEKLEKLKAQKIEITDQITTLEEELAKSGDTTKVEEGRVKNVAVTAIAPASFVHSVDIQGRIEGDENVTLMPKAQGPITKIYLRAGNNVKAGQIIAEIDNDLVKAQLRDVKTGLELAKSTYEKQKNLWEQKVGTEMQYLQAKANKESLEAKLAQAEENLDMYLIKSPITGVVDDMPLKIGQFVSPATPNAGVRVVNLGELKVKADLSEAYAGAVTAGDKAEVTFPDIDKTITSNVKYVARVINPSTRTFTIEIALNGSDDYRPNMVAEIHVVDYTKANALVVPINTVQQLDGQTLVYVATKEGNKTVAKKRVVKVGKMYNGKAEILSGLNQGEQLITTGYLDLSENEVIKF